MENILSYDIYLYMYVNIISGSIYILTRLCSTDLEIEDNLTTKQVVFELVLFPCSSVLINLSLYYIHEGGLIIIV